MSGTAPTRPVMMKLIVLASIVSVALSENKNNCISPKKDPLCFGLGEYDIHTHVTKGKCPQLNLVQRNATHPKKIIGPTTVLARKCIINGNVTTGQPCYSVKTAVWEKKRITGIGLNGYWTEFETTIGKDKYGWIDGVIPDGSPNQTQLTEGLEVLCRNPQITGASTFDNVTAVSCNPDTNPLGCWMEGQLVGESPGGSWVCKLSDATRPLIPFTPITNIRPLCFAKSADPKTGATCDFRDDTCDTCAPYCSIPINQSGYLCPKQVTLGLDVLKYDTGKKSNHLYNPGRVTGMYFLSMGDLLSGNNLQYQIDGAPAAPVWGPQPTSAEYIIPNLNASNITGMSFGQYVLCPYPPNMPTGQTYKAGTIYNTPLQTADKTYHVYGCDDVALSPTEAMKCAPADMKSVCWPTTL